MYSHIPYIKVLKDKRGKLVREFGLYSKYHKTCISYYPYIPYNIGENYMSFLSSVHFQFCTIRTEKYI